MGGLNWQFPATAPGSLGVRNYMARASSPSATSIMPERRRLSGVVAFLETPRGAWIVLGTAMMASVVLILITSHGESFGIDEMFYLGRMVEDSGHVVQFHSLSLEYLLGPYNGHLQIGGKLIYEATFAIFGTDYTA